jgi:soluble cytochrome b562
MSTLKMRLISGLMLASIGIIAGGVATAGEIKQDMKVMNKNMKAAMSSNSIEEISGYVRALKNAAWEASNLNFDGSAAEQNTYREGLTKLQNQFGDVDRAINNRDLEGAKNALDKLRQTQKEYHNKLDV